MILEPQAIMKAFDEWLESLLLSQKLPIIVQPEHSPGVKVSTKGSYFATAKTRGDIGFSSQCELYTLVDYVSPSQLVAHRSALKVSPCYIVSVFPLIW